MELSEALRRRHMVRAYAPEPVAPEVVDRLLTAGRRSPSAGFTQGVSFLVLTAAEDRERYWELTSGGADTRWLRGMRTAPVLILVWTSETAYLDRYAEPDKGLADRDPHRWVAPYWFVDAGMAAMAILLAAVDAGLGACFFGVPPERVASVRAAYGVPDEQLSVGVISVGMAVGTGSFPGSGRRPRREDLVHRGRW